MPELPEVQTTVNGLRSRIVGLSIKDVWTNYNSPYYKGSQTVKDPVYFKEFKKKVIGAKVISIERRAKNILINLKRPSDKDGGSTILIHMKMTGHLLYGQYKFDSKNKKDPWTAVSPVALSDPFNRFIRLVFIFNNGKKLALSDMRRFAKVTLVSTEIIHQSIHLDGVGPEPLEKSFTLEKFMERLNMRPNGKIKTVLMDQTVVAGIGNIYSDEALWRSGIHPKELVKNIPRAKIKLLYAAILKVLAKGIDFGGDSMSDYRNVDGEMGKFQEHHSAYRQTGKKCTKPRCGGTITRLVVGGRSAHFCDRHQKLIKPAK